MLRFIFFLQKGGALGHYSLHLKALCNNTDKVLTCLPLPFSSDTLPQNTVFYYGECLFQTLQRLLLFLKNITGGLPESIRFIINNRCTI